MICSRCGKEITDMYVRINTSFEVIKITEEGCHTPYSNLSEPTSEILCQDCFNDYCECLDSLNKMNDGVLVADMIQVIDDVQYGPGIPRVSSDYFIPESEYNEDCNCSAPIENDNLAQMVDIIDE